MANENETVEQVCEDLKNKPYWWNPFILADFILAAHKRELAAKDALIKELADALNDAKEEFEIRKNCEFDDDVVVEYCDKNIIRIGALVAKAREVVGENRAKDGAAQDGRAE